MQRKFSSYNRFGIQRGVTLIEVLVALLVLSIGLVGIAALNLFAVRAVHSALQSSAASIVALDAEEWLWEAVGNNQLSTCGQLDSVTSSVADHWFGQGAGAGRITLPAGEITAGTCERRVVGLDCVMGADITVTWSEGRFEMPGTDPESTEVFEYRVQVPCRTAPTGGS